MKNLSLFATCLLCIAATALPRAALAAVREDLLALSEGKRVKLAWQRDFSTANNGVMGKSDTFELVVFDTDVGSEQTILSTRDDYSKPLITHDGSRIVFSDRKDKKVRVVSWNGGTITTLKNGFAGAIWFDESTSTQWVYYQEDYNGDDPDSADYPIKRFNLDNPGQTELVYDMSGTSIQWAAISKDGTRFMASFPWPYSKLIAPNYDGSGNATRTDYANGCWTTITPDDTYRVGVFDGAHRNWKVKDTPSSSEVLFALSTAPGLEAPECTNPAHQTWEVYHPKHSNSPRFLVLTGPYKVNTSGSDPCGKNNITGGGPAVEVYFGKIDEAFRHVTNWVKVTSNTRGDFYPDAWIQPGSATAVRIDSFGAQPTAIIEGGSATLTWETTNANSVTLTPGGAVSADGSTSVSPTQTTTYRLTAVNDQGSVHRDVTVTVWPIEELHMKINAGDGSPSVDGWQDEDAFRTGGAAYDFGETPDVSGLADAAPAALYATCIHNDHSYSFPLPNGNYLVRLHMYDPYNSAERAMDYTIEGVKVLDDFNPGAAGIVSVQSFGVTVSDNNGLQIIATKDSGNDAFESGIEILVAPDDDTVNPTVEIQSPNDNTHVTGAVTFTGTASDDNILSRVEILIDGSAVGVAEGTSSWSYSFITESLEDGEHTVTARALDASGNAGTDSITIVTENGQSIELISPNANTVWRAGTTASIQWSTTNLANVMIMYSLDGGASYHELAQTVLDTDAQWGNYPWQVPNAPTARARILVQGYFGEAPVESAVFEIKGDEDGVILTQPTGDLVATAGEPIDIRWTAQGVGFVLLEYSLEDGLDWTVIDVVKSSDEAWGHYEWIAPWASTPYARVRAFVSDGAFDLSDPFVIGPPPDLVPGDVDVERIVISGHIPSELGDVDEVTIQGRTVEVRKGGSFAAEIQFPVGMQSVVVGMEVGSMRRLMRVDITEAQPPIDGLEVSEDELRAFLGGRGGVLTWVDGGGAVQVLDFGGANPQVRALSSDVDCVNPLISPDGTRILYSVGSASGTKLIRVRDLAGDNLQELGAGDVGYWHNTAAGDHVVYCDWSDKEDNGASGNTYRQPLVTGGTALDGEATVIHDRAMDAGINADGRWLGQVYNNLWAYDGLRGREFPPSSFFLEDGVPASHQTCNGSMAPDTTARLMTLVIPHDWVRIFAYNEDRDRFEMTSQFELPAGSQEWEFPEWSTDPAYFTAVLRGPDLKFAVYIGKVTTGTLVPQLLRITRRQDNATYSHLFVAP